MAESSSSGKLRLELYASGLKNVAGVGKGTSDPYAVVTLLSSNPNEKPVVLGKTEVVKNSLSPRWVTCFDIDYEFGRLSRVNVGLYDENRKRKNVSMGSALFEVGEVLGARGNTKAKVLRKGGTLFCRVQPAHLSSSGVLRLNLAGRQLKNVEGLFGKSDPFFELNAAANSAGGATWHPVYRSKHIKNNLNPDWESFSIDIDRLCGGDLDKAIQIQVFDHEKSGKHINMGSFETSVNGLLQSVGHDGFEAKRKGKPFGKIVVKSATIEGGLPNGDSEKMIAPTPTPSASSTTDISPIPPPVVPEPSAGAYGGAAAIPIPSVEQYQSSAPPGPFVPKNAPVSLPPAASPVALPPALAPPAPKPQFVDYISGGCEIELSIAIDFTGSNGDPRKPGTLHHIHRDGQLNDYEKAITAVGAIVGRYDTDQKFPVLGFGAKIGGVIRHCFQVGTSPELERIQGVLEGYRSVFHTGLTMSGPTDISEVINFCAATSRSKQEASLRIGQQSYRILLILTDGAVSDIEATKRALDAASDAPLSIVIVGIGHADFSGMRFLDDFQAHGGTGRDICQFVEFSKYQHDKAALTRETLCEIPGQLVDYFHGRGIKPLPPVSSSQVSLYPDAPTDEDIDLSIAVNEEGEISLENWDGAIYDDTKYDSFSTFVTPIPPPTAPPAPYQPAAFIPSAPPAAYNPAPPVQEHGYQPYVQHPKQRQHQPGGGYGSSQPVDRIFHVQVPPGVVQGTQLQVQNPVTRQMMIVSVPPGVPPGSKFGVRY